MNTFRVDRADSMRVPCGMNSILYIGDDFREERAECDALIDANPHCAQWEDDIELRWMGYAMDERLGMPYGSNMP